MNLVQNLGGATPIKIWGPKTPNFGQFSTLPVHCSKTDQDIANLKRIIKLETFLYQIVNVVLWSTMKRDRSSFAPALRFVFQSFHKVTR